MNLIFSLFYFSTIGTELNIGNLVRHPCLTEISNFIASGDEIKNKYPSGDKNSFNFITGDIYFHCFQSKKSSRDGKFKSKLYDGDSDTPFFLMGTKFEGVFFHRGRILGLFFQ